MQTTKDVRIKKLLSFGFALSMSVIPFKSIAAPTDIEPALPLIHDVHTHGSDYASLSELELHKARTKYQLAMKYLESGSIKSYQKLRAELDGYPLVNYLDYTFLKKHLTHSDYFPQIEVYLYEHKDTLQATKLQREWLYALSKQKNWSKFIEQYDYNVNSDTLKCEYFWAHYNSGNKELALAAAPALWLSASSQPKTCDKLFEAWASNGQLTQTIVWERFNLAIENKKISLAKYLVKKLTGAKKDLANNVLSIYRDPRQIVKLGMKDYTDDDKAYLMSLAVTRLARKNPLESFELWLALRTENSFLINYASFEESLKFVATRLAVNYDKKAYEVLTLVDPYYYDKELTVLKLRVSLRESAWTQVLEGLKYLPLEDQRDDVWQYWRAKALLSQGKKEQKQEVNNILLSLADKRSFYGFLAAEILEQDYEVINIPLVSDPMVSADLEKRLATHRVIELRAMGEVIQARREWHYQTSYMSGPELIAAAKLAKKWEWHNKAIRTSITAKLWDDLDLRFPIVYEEWINQHAEKNKIDSSWVFAVARQESAFLEDARSHVGATGLLQLMPGTAKQTARKSGISYKNQSELVNPKTNIVIGTAYLREMLQKFNGNKAYATAAYNAGPYRVQTWLKGAQAQLPLDIWIETIPYSETRRYVKNVLTFDIIYDTRLEVAAQSLAFIIKDDALLQSIR